MAEAATGLLWNRRAVLRRGDQVPHFEVSTADGRAIRYTDIWQSKNLVFVSADSAATQYLNRLQARADDFTAADTVLVVSSDKVPGLPSPGAVVADKWGEIAYVFDRHRTTPTADELLEWVNFVRMKCPECPP